MPNELQFAPAVVALVATYLLHSTLLLAGVWLILAITGKHSAALQERLWKVAAIAPLLTAPLQFAGADRFNATSVWTLPAISFASPPDATPLSAPRQPPASFTVSQPSALAPPQSAPREPAVVEIIPGPSVPNESGDDTLPIIEPAPAPSLAFAPSPDLLPIVEPAVTPVEVPSETLPLVDSVAGLIPGESRTRVSPHAAAEPVDGWRVWLALTVTGLVLLGLARIAWRAAAARWRFRAIRTLSTGPLRGSLDRLLIERNIRKPVRLACSAAASEPAAGGILRWMIVVPDGIESRLAPTEQHALLAHEVAHLVRRDPLWLWIGTALCWCLPFQPFNLLAVRRWRHAAEELCDDWAIDGGVEPLALAKCLTRVAEWRLAPMPVGLTADIGKSRFARRIARLIHRDPQADRWTTPARRRLFLAAALGGAALLTCCGPRMQAASRVGSPESVSSRITPDASRDVRAKPQATWEGLSAAMGEMDDANGADVRGDLAALLTDLERLDTRIGDTSDDPELESARATLRSRIEAIRHRATR